MTNAPAGSVGVFLSTWLPVEVDNLDVADWLAKTAYFDTKQVVAGRVVTLKADTIVDPFDGGGVASGGPGLFAIEPGTFELPAGLVILSPVFGGSFQVGSCCGTLGSAESASCAGNGALPPEPVCDGPRSYCAGFQLSNSIDIGPGFGGSITGDRLSCDHECLIAGDRALCDSNNPPPSPAREPVGVVDVCTPSDGVDVTRVCQAVASGATDCPGFCEGHPNEICGAPIGREGVGFPDNACLIQGRLEGCYGDGPDSVTGLTMVDMFGACLHAGGVLESCSQYFQPRHGLLGAEEKVVVACARQSPSERCSVCSEHSTGGVCIPVRDLPELPIGSAFDADDANPWMAPTVDKEPNLSALAELALRPGVDPRVADTTGDPVALPTGELLLEGEDVAFPSRGVPFALHRWYRSGASRSGALGPGWNHSYEERLEVIGDDFNRNGVPLYCTIGLPKVANCLLLHSGGGSTLFVRKADSPVFVAASGGFGTIVGTSQLRTLATARAAAPDVFGGEQLPLFAYEMRSPGGVIRTFDFTGVLLSITDELGFGVALDWQLRTLDETKKRAWWSGSSAQIRRRRS